MFYRWQVVRVEPEPGQCRAGVLVKGIEGLAKAERNVGEEDGGGESVEKP